LTFSGKIELLEQYYPAPTGFKNSDPNNSAGSVRNSEPNFLVILELFTETVVDPLCVWDGRGEEGGGGEGGRGGRGGMRAMREEGKKGEEGEAGEKGEEVPIGGGIGV
jgi:hypothetical protein